MTITIAGYTFEGPYSSTSSLEDRSGVYAILCRKNSEQYTLVDVGESATVRTRVDNHDRKSCWIRNCNSSLAVAVLYTPHLQQPGRMEIEQEIRTRLRLPCGAR